MVTWLRDLDGGTNISGQGFAEPPSKTAHSFLVRREALQKAAERQKENSIFLSPLLLGLLQDASPNASLNESPPATLHDFFLKLSEPQQKNLEKKLGKDFLKECFSLSVETDPEIFLEGSLELARRFANQGRIEASALLLSLLQQKDVPDSVRREAQNFQTGLLGSGSSTYTWEFTVDRFCEGATQPSMLVSMGLAAASFQVFRLGILSNLLNSKTAGFLTRGVGASVASTFGGFLAETSTFTLAEHGINALLSHPQQNSLAQDWVSNGLFIGSMKLAGWGGQEILERAGKVGKFTQMSFMQASQLSGIILGKKTEEWVGLKEARSGSNLLTDSLVFLLQAQVGGHLSEGLWGKSFHAWQNSLNLRAKILENEGPPRPPALWHPMTELAFPKMSVAEGPSVSHIMLSTYENSPKGKGIVALVKRAEDKPQLALVEFPELLRTLPLSWRETLKPSPLLSEFLQSFSEDLKKMDQTLGDPAYHGVAPFVARAISEVMLLDSKMQIKLYENPAVRILVSALRTHYEGIKEPIGTQIYRDLQGVMKQLSRGELKDKIDAEDTILQNLELDPLNPWFIPIGLELSRELGDLAIKKPEYYEELQKAVRKVPDQWKESELKRAFDEKIIGKFRRNFLKAAWEKVSWYGFVMGVLGPVLEIISGIVLGPAQIIRWANRLFKMGKSLKAAPDSLLALRRKANFEIHLYYGDYKSAVESAEPGSKLIVTSEVLRRQNRSLTLQKEITLEKIPNINPQAATQMEAIAGLENKLALSTIVSLEGLPGSAKTYLAVQLANKYRHDPDRPVFWYTFKEGKRPDLHRAFDHLGFFLESKNPVTERGLFSKIQEVFTLEEKIELLRAALHRTPSLLFWDNFDTVSEDTEASEYFGQLAKGGLQDSKMLTITRRSPEWLKKIGAQIFAQEGMLFADAQQLFKNLGVLQEFSHEDLRETYRVLMGRPMALNLFGQLIASDGAKAIKTHLEVLRTKKNRAEKLKYLFDRVFESLSSPQRSLLQYLSVFREPVSPSALTFFSPHGEESGSYLLLPLREYFLIEERDPGFFILHEKFQALSKLTLNDSKELHHRAAEYYRFIAQMPLDYLEAAHHYFQAGELERSLQMLSGKTRTLLSKGYQVRVEGLLAPLHEDPQMRHRDQAIFYEEKAELLRWKKEWKQAIEALKKGLYLRRSMQDFGAVIEIYQDIGEILQEQGNFKGSIDYFVNALGLAEKHKDRNGIARSHFLLAQAYQQQGKVIEACAEYQSALKVQEALSDSEAKAHTLWKLGLLENEQGKTESAVEHLREAYEIFRKNSDLMMYQVEKALKEL